MTEKVGEKNKQPAYMHRHMHIYKLLESF